MDWGMVKGFVNYLKEEKASFALSLGMVYAGIVIQNMLTVVCELGLPAHSLSTTLS